MTGDLIAIFVATKKKLLKSCLLSLILPTSHFRKNLSFLFIFRANAVGKKTKKIDPNYIKMRNNKKEQHLFFRKQTIPKNNITLINNKIFGSGNGFLKSVGSKPELKPTITEKPKKIAFLTRFVGYRCNSIKGKNKLSDKKL